jgi:tetratricopeptide (TPR) repeat protein
VWLTLGPNATLPDVLAAILNSLNMYRPDFFLLKPEQQIELLVEVLRRPQESTFVVLDQFEELLNPEDGQYHDDRQWRGHGQSRAKGWPEAPQASSPAPLHVNAGRGALPLFLRMMQKDIGASCLLLTCSSSPYGPENFQETRVRSYLISRMSMPEGVALLLQRDVRGTSRQELSLVWQRCGGHTYALVLFSTLFALCGFSLSYLLDSPDYAPLWSGEVTLNLIGAIYSYLNPMQRTLLRALSLFTEPVPLSGIVVAITGSGGDSLGSHDIQAFERELDRLTQLSLVQRHEERYMLHPLLRQYTREQGGDQLGGAGPDPYMSIGNDRSPSGDLGVEAPINPMRTHPEARQIALAAGHMRVAAYYFQLAQQYCPPREQRRSLQDIEPFVFVVRHLCLGWHWQQAYDLLLEEGLCESMVQWGGWNTLIGLYKGMLPPNGVLTRKDQGQALSMLGLLYDRLGDSSQSVACYQQALAVQWEINDVHGQVITLTNSGELFRSHGQYEQARANFEQALMLNRQQYDPLLESVILHDLGLLYQAEKDYGQAMSCYLESLKLARHEQYNEGMILTNSGILLYEEGYVVEALALLFAAVQLRQSISDPTVGSLLLFFNTLEQRLGSEMFARLCQEARAIQERPEEVLARRAASNMRQ